MTAKDAIHKIQLMLGLDTDGASAKAKTVEVELASATLVDGTVVEVEGDFEVGKALLVVTEEGNIPAPEGSHETTDGYIITVDEAGIIVSIEEKVMEVEAPAEEVVVEEASFSNDLIDSIAKMIKPLVDEVQSLKAELTSVQEQFSSFKDEPATGKITNNLKEHKQAETDKYNERFTALKRIKDSN